MSLYTCPCCGHMAFDAFPGSYEICPICCWEDDALQLYFPNSDGGANNVSLIEAQVNYFQSGACEHRLRDKARLPDENDIKDPTWFPLYQKRVNIPDRESSDTSVGNIRAIKKICYWLCEDN